MKREKFDIFSVLWTILLHALAIVLLLVLHLNRPVAQAESGVPVMLGNMGRARHHPKSGGDRSN